METQFSFTMIYRLNTISTKVPSRFFRYRQLSVYNWMERESELEQLQQFHKRKFKESNYDFNTYYKDKEKSGTVWSWCWDTYLCSATQENWEYRNQFTQMWSLHWIFLKRYNNNSTRKVVYSKNRNKWLPTCKKINLDLKPHTCKHELKMHHRLKYKGLNYKCLKEYTRRTFFNCSWVTSSWKWCQKPDP